MDTTTRATQGSEAGAVHSAIETYRSWVETLTGHMKRAAALLENLYVEQDQVIDQLKKLSARTHCLRHADFDAIFAEVLARRRETRQSLSALVDSYCAGRETVIQEVEQLFFAGKTDRARAVKDWPAVKERLLSEKGEGADRISAALRQVHVEQQKVSTALTEMLMRGDKLKVEDLKTVARKLASRDSRNSAELAALLAACDSAGRNAARKWEQLVA